MVGSGGVSGLARFGLVAAGPQMQRLQPSSANEFFIVTPIVGGAMVYRIIRNNNGVVATPPASIGGTFAQWRLAGVGFMRSAAGNAASPDFWWSNDIGAQDYAVSFASVYGGSYHGGEATTANDVLANGVVVADITQARTASQFSIRHSSTITWSAGNTAAVTEYTLSFNPDGSLTETCPFNSTLSFTEALFGLLIASDGTFTEARVNDSGITVPLVSGRAILGLANDITIRAPSNGRWIRQTANAPAQSGYSRTEFRNAGRAKLYCRLSGVVGSKTLQRDIVFGQNWFGSGLNLGANLIGNSDFSAGLTGWQVQAGSSAAVVGGALRLTRQAAAESRVMQPFATVVGGLYLMMATTSSAADVSLNYGVTSNSNFSTSTPAPPIMQSPFVDGGSTQINVHLFIADQTTHYAMARQLAGTAGATGDFVNMAVFRPS